MPLGNLQKGKIKDVSEKEGEKYCIGKGKGERGSGKKGSGVAHDGAMRSTFENNIFGTIEQPEETKYTPHSKIASRSM